MIYLYIFSSVFIISLISLIGAVTLSFKKNFLQKILFVFVGLAAGALFGDAMLHLLPEAFENIPNPVTVSLLVLSGIIIFFMFEKFLLWHHSHGIEEDEECLKTESIFEEKTDTHIKKIKPLGVLVLASDAIHNFADGVIIAAGFLISIEIGIATTLAVALHEVPQEIADFALLIHSGMKKFQALLWNFAIALFAVLGALIVVFAGPFLEAYVFHIGAFAAGIFIYIAGSDLVPEIHKTRDFKKSALQFVSIIVGIAIMLSLTALEGDENSDEIKNSSNIAEVEQMLNKIYGENGKTPLETA